MLFQCVYLRMNVCLSRMLVFVCLRSVVALPSDIMWVDVCEKRYRDMLFKNTFTWSANFVWKVKLLRGMSKTMLMSIVTIAMQGISLLMVRELIAAMLWKKKIPVVREAIKLVVSVVGRNYVHIWA